MKKLLPFLLLSVLININAQTLITATIPYQGYEETQSSLGQAEFQIFIDNTDGVLDKPVFLIDGFDPGDTRSIAQMYNLLGFNGQNFGDVLRNEGFDLVLLNFPTYINENDDTINGGADYIQRNAFSLIELINQINEQKVGNEELVVIGPSMGGLIARYALRYMEQNSLDHQTRLYVSWDSPHLGANIPIGLQYFLNFLGEQNGNEQIQDLVANTLESPAAKQMLLDHFLSHLADGSTFEQNPTLKLPVGAPNFRDAFQSELDAMGFPQQTRNISIANGSGIGLEIGSPGTNMLDGTFDIPIPNFDNAFAEIVINFTPAANQTIEVTNVGVFAQILPEPLPVTQLLSFVTTSESPSDNDGYDSAPGGKSDLNSIIGDTQGNPLLEDFVAALNQSSYSFIPTMSSLAISNTNDFHDSPDIGGIHDSPFVAWIIPDDNEDHVTLTQANVDFVLPEIRNEVVSVNDNIFTNKYILKGNPVVNNISIQLNNSYNYNNVSITVVNITGQKLLQTNYISVLNEINIPVNLNSGVYFLTINDSETTINKKFVVK